MSEEKELLLKDLCGRLPYGVIGVNSCGNPSKLDDITEFTPLTAIKYKIMKYDWKPYLFPMSSMTEEQKEEFRFLVCHEKEWQDAGLHKEEWGWYYTYHEGEYQVPDEAIDWLNAHHLDYRGLVEKGLAIDATGLNIY